MTGLPTNVTLFIGGPGVKSLEATGVAWTLEMPNTAREKAGELDVPTSRERTLGHTVWRLLAYIHVHV